MKKDIEIRYAMDYEIRPIVKMSFDYVDDLKNAGDPTTNISIKQAIKAEHDNIKNKRLISVLIDNKLIGFVHLFDTDGHRGIKDMYIIKSFRKQGHAREIRKILMDNFNVKSIEITFERAKKLHHYYKEQGFDRCALHPNDLGGDDKTLCIVTADDTFSISLDLEGLETLQNISKLSLLGLFEVMK